MATRDELVAALVERCAWGSRLRRVASGISARRRQCRHSAMNVQSRKSPSVDASTAWRLLFCEMLKPIAKS
jgi:hypothetical protein